jgi:hypothetical protein
MHVWMNESRKVNGDTTYGLASRSNEKETKKEERLRIETALLQTFQDVVQDAVDIDKPQVSPSIFVLA